MTAIIVSYCFTVSLHPTWSFCKFFGCSAWC